jgi:hypothetical protein
MSQAAARAGRRRNASSGTASMAPARGSVGTGGVAPARGTIGTGGIAPARGGIATAGVAPATAVSAATAIICEGDLAGRQIATRQ